MNLDQMLDLLSPEQYESLKRAVELGKWPDGQHLSQQQKGDALQVLIAYDARKKPEHDRVGFIHQKAHDHCGSESIDEDNLDQLIAKAK